jgi:hypothetical protein
MHAFNRLAEVRTQRRSLLSLFALLAICLIALHPLPSMASENARKIGKKETKITLKASASVLKQGKKLTLTATVSPSKATGTVTFYSKRAPNLPFLAVEQPTLVNGVAKISGFLGSLGDVEFKAVYNGSSAYTKSTSKIVTVLSTP